ncbi:hypothetical protein FF2_044125 [Malus domestica]
MLSPTSHFRNSIKLTNVLKSSVATEKPNGGIGIKELHFNKDDGDGDGDGGGSAEFEPSSMFLTKMVQNFIEESNEKQSLAVTRCSQNRCNCFNENCNNSSDLDFRSEFEISRLIGEMLEKKVDSVI